MASHTATPLTWTDLDQRAVDTARVLAVDAVQNVGHGHPGAARSLAPAAHALFQKAMHHDLADAQWIGRDRFVLSPGHTSLTLSTQLFLSGYGLELDDLKAFRSAGSKTPGHPEYGHTTGVETTTGPLGQGIATAAGMAMAAPYGRGLYDPEAPGGASVFDHTIWAIVPDGDLEEGVFAEASSPASPQRLGNLVALWDDNHISIEVDTATAFSEDVLKRYEAYGWHVQRIDQAPNGDLDVHVLYAALGAAQAETGRPSLIAARTVIAWPAPHRAEHPPVARCRARRRGSRGHQTRVGLPSGAGLRGRHRGVRRPAHRQPGARGRVRPDHRRRALLLPPGGQPSAECRPVRTDRPLRHPRTRHGRRDERHRPCTATPVPTAGGTAIAWREILRRDDAPHGLVLTRQNAPAFPADDAAPGADT